MREIPGDARRRSADTDAALEHIDVFAENLAALDASIAEEGLESDSVVSQIRSNQELRSAATALRLLERVRKSEQRRPPADSTVHLSGGASPDHLSMASELFAANSDAVLPTTIGRFQIQQRLGHGGYGIVFLAFDPKLKRQVAIKVPRLQTLMTPEMRERFLREGEMAGALDHPGIVRVFECGNAGPLWYLVSAYCEGIALDDWLQQRPEPISAHTAARLVRGLADAIHHAHSRGVLHRDLKPGNVLLELADPNTCSVDDIGDAGRITDFGLAKIMSVHDTQVSGSAAGDIIGTPAYMSPEQANGRLHEVGVGSDIYGLGCLLYQLLTRRLPFEADSTVAVLDAVRNDAVVPPANLRPDVPADLNATCLKCLEKSPADRYETAAHLRDDLHRFLHHQPVVARPVSITERFRRWCRRNPVVSSLTSLVVLLLLALVAGSTTAAVLLARAQKDTLDSLEAEILAKDKATQQEEQAIFALYEARLALASARRNSGLPGRRFDSLDAVVDAGRQAKRLKLGDSARMRRRNEAIAAMALVDLRLNRKWSATPPRTTDSSIGIDSQASRYARLESDGRIVVRDMIDNRELAALPGLGTLEKRPWTMFSPSGRYLAVRGQGEESLVRIQIWNLDAPDAPVFDFKTAYHTHLRDIAFSDDGNAFAFCQDETTIGVLNMQTMETERLLHVRGIPAWLQFSPDGKLLAMSFINKLSRVVFLDVDSGEMAGQSCQHPLGVHDIAWSHNGLLMATACRDGNVYVWDAKTRRQLTVCRGHRHIVNEVAFAHHSELLMSTAWDMTTRLWEPLTGRQLLRTNGRAGDFSEDDRWLGMAFAGVGIGRWELASSREFFILPGTNDASFPYDLDYSADGRFLAVACQKAGAEVWDMQTRRKVAALPLQCSSVRFAEGDSSLFVGGLSNGILQLPFEYDAEAAELQIGPEQLRFMTRYDKARISLNGDCTKAIVNTSWSRAVLRNLQTDRTIHILRSADCRFHDISTDGRWIAAGNWRGNGVKVWDADSGELVRELPLLGSVRVRFSPNGQWLLTCSYDEHCLWKAGTWEPIHRMEHDGFSYRNCGISNDGRLAAVTLLDSVLLLDLSTGQELARLTPPDQFIARTVALSPDGRQLALGTQEGAVCVWQLDQLRARLAEMDLDWQQPKQDVRSGHAVPVRSTVHLAPYSSSSAYNENFAANLAFDGDPTTRWNSAHGDGNGAWIARQWNAPRSIHKMIIHQAFDRIAGFRVQQLSTEFNRWTDVAVLEAKAFREIHNGADLADSRDETVNPVFTIVLPEPITTRGMRLLITDAADTISIREIQFP